LFGFFSIWFIQATRKPSIGLPVISLVDQLSARLTMHHSPLSQAINEIYTLLFFHLWQIFSSLINMHDTIRSIANYIFSSQRTDCWKLSFYQAHGKTNNKCCLLKITHEFYWSKNWIILIMHMMRKDKICSHRATDERGAELCIFQLWLVTMTVTMF
jgi:hypothetical protein